jgi:uncharacterized secreted protein with C-terminal beta-propeller domain
MRNSVLFVSRGRISIYVFTAFLMGVLLINSSILIIPHIPVFRESSSFPNTLERFTSYSELKNFMSTHRVENHHQSWKFGLRDSIVTLESLSSGRGDNSQSNDYSRTNIQVEGVDERDLVKTDGEYIYLASGRGVHIIRSYPSIDSELLSTIQLEGQAMNIYINGDKLIVLQGSEHGTIRYGAGDTPYPLPYLEETLLHVYDVTDRGYPELERSIKADGYLIDTRMIGDYLYLITQQANIVYNETEVWLPSFRDGEREIKVEADMIYYHNVTDEWFSYTHIISVNIKTHEEMGHETFLMGGTSTLYASMENIYLTGYQWDEEGGGTRIFKISIDGRSIEYTADGIVPGTVLNQFSLDEDKGYFRIVTQTSASNNGESTRGTNLYILNGSLGVVGTITGLAPGENLHSARFMGDRAYLVTFKKVDPLFTLDLSNPGNPRILGKLKIPGYSDYLHPYDENILIGIGKETVEAEDPNWDFAWHQGIKISLFNVTDITNPQELAKMEIGDRGSDTPVLRDHKALLFSKERNLLVIPILEAEIDEENYSKVPDNAYGDYVYQGAYIFNITSEGIKLRGKVTQIDNPDEFIKFGWYYTSDYTITRSLYIEEVLYTISNKRLQLNRLDNLELIKKIELN